MLQVRLQVFRTLQQVLQVRLQVFGTLQNHDGIIISSANYFLGGNCVVESKRMSKN